MPIWYEFCAVDMQDGMVDHPTGSVRHRVDAEGGVWLLDETHPGPTDEEVMRPIIDAAMREDNGS
jgi:hypothetical protein